MSVVRPSHLASEAVPGVDAKLPAVVPVVARPRVHGARVPAVALLVTVDGPGRGAEPLRHDLVHVVHPVPERRLERHHGVLRHPLRVLQPVEPDALPRRPVVVVPRQLQRAAPVVPFPRGAWPLRVLLVAVVLARSVDLLRIAQMSGLVRDVGEEGGDLGLGRVVRAALGEARVGAGGGQERLARVKALAGAPIAGLGPDPVEEGLGDDALHRHTDGARA